MIALLAAALLLHSAPAVPKTAAPKAKREAASVAVTVTPGAAGKQLVRLSLPMPAGTLKTGQTLTASDGKQDIEAGVRVLTRYPGSKPALRSARRALVTFPYDFADKQPVPFTLRPVPDPGAAAPRLPVEIKVTGETVTIAYRDGPTLTARLLAPARQSSKPARVETVESNAHYLWQCIHLPDAQWPREIEVRADALGGVTLVAHLQRNLPDGYTPDFGWEVETTTSACHLLRDGGETAVGETPIVHEFGYAKPCTFLFENGRYRLDHPQAPFRWRGHLEAALKDGKNLTYRYLCSTEAEKVAMQQASWRRAELVIAPASLAPLTATLESPHAMQVDWKAWDALYNTGPPLDLKATPELAAALRYHHEAMLHCMAGGEDWGNVTAYTDGSKNGGVIGMNRLNHAPLLFEEGYRSGDRRLVEEGVLWCENFYDHSIWWGPEETGGTRYPNLLAIGMKTYDTRNRYMWRSDSAVSYCTKGFDAFFVAYEQTGDPRMKEALDAQVAYATHSIHATLNFCRNIGAVRDFMRLYRYTGEDKYLDEGLRLFRELRALLSTGNLFSESGKQLEADPPFIDDDDTGAEHPYAKPYILGYALEGLPELARHFPNESKLQEVVRDVADFLADSQDPLGGWRYPHPRSSRMIVSQGIEHSWQIVQADSLLGPQEKHLDAIERALRARLLGWRKTGKIFNELLGWEMATGRIKQDRELSLLYKRPADRDLTQDYTQGKPDFGISSPEGLVYFPDVLAYYLKHRPASNLLADPKPDEPLGKVLNRIQ